MCMRGRRHGRRGQRRRRSERGRSSSTRSWRSAPSARGFGCECKRVCCDAVQRTTSRLHLMQEACWVKSDPHCRAVSVQLVVCGHCCYLLKRIDGVACRARGTHVLPHKLTPAARRDPCPPCNPSACAPSWHRSPSLNLSQRLLTALLLWLCHRQARNACPKTLHLKTQLRRYLICKLSHFQLHLNAHKVWARQPAAARCAW